MPFRRFAALRQPTAWSEAKQPPRDKTMSRRSASKTADGRAQPARKTRPGQVGNRGRGGLAIAAGAGAQSRPEHARNRGRRGGQGGSAIAAGAGSQSHPGRVGNRGRRGGRGRLAIAAGAATSALAPASSPIALASEKAKKAFAGHDRSSSVDWLHGGRPSYHTAADDERINSRRKLAADTSDTRIPSTAGAREGP